MLKHKNILTLTYKFTNTQTTPPFIFLTLNEQQNFLNLFLQKIKQKVFKETKNCIKKERTRKQKKKVAKRSLLSICVSNKTTVTTVCRLQRNGNTCMPNMVGKKRKYMTTH